ncbi:MULTISPECIES: DUF2271 domain-containing protein [unclassified Dyella]|uniref:DUF2271 domain-containing protein n=1 Tax=unclassified Dyella TaxID=2634549 RepID=UPI000C82ECE2|nr:MULTISPECIES: DUF2271 domain-containing protein [unclassified Dyella]MDR3444607.1 DUF2271 domain-containing protein [Dyella sp.]PMQ05665.1 hypothetical protein DyAD56_10050 [Dyella sp. AD56]
MRRLSLTLPAILLAAPAVAADLNVTVQIPQLNVAEYHRPYTAVWVEREDHSVAAQLAVWYAQKESKEGAGTKWLPELRQWWRRGGRELQMPVDGVSGATRPSGDQKLSFHEGKAPLGQLAPGKYELVVEAAREVGGREVVRVPFTWPATASQQLAAQGSSELGSVKVDLAP